MTIQNPSTSAAGLTSREPCSVSLSFDALFSVIPWIQERKDLYSFIVTCSDLYHTGIPALLGFHYRITTRILASFYTFLISKPPSSFLALRSLDLCFPTWPPNAKPDSDDFSMITDILSRSKGLIHMKINGINSNQGSAAYQALARLQTLESLDLDGCEASEDEQRTVLAQLRSPLADLSIQTSDEDGDIVTALCNFRHTLERVVISGSSMCRAAPVNFNYPNLIDLELEAMSHIQLSVLVPAFPNLKHLTIKYVHDAEEPELELLHTTNRRFQQEHPNQAWHLLSLSGAVRALYALGLQARVPNVTITAFSTDLETEVASLCAVLTQLRPLMLSVEGVEEPIFEMDWLATVITDQWHELVRLDLDLTFDDSDFVNGHEERLNVLFRELHVVSRSNPALSFLCINLIISGYEPSETSELGFDFVDTLDMLSLAKRALLAIPTLKVSRFVLCGREVRQSYCMYQEIDPKITEVPPEGFAFMDDFLEEKTESVIRAYTSAVNAIMTQSQTN